MFSDWIASLKASRAVRKIRAESGYLRELRRRFTSELAASRCLVLGSAPHPIVPRLRPGDKCIGVNGSPYVAKCLGLVDPIVTVISGYTTALKSAKSQATIPVWRGLWTEEIVFVETGDTEEHARSVLAEAEFRYERFTKVSKHERAAIVGEVCGVELGLGDHSDRVSNGMFAACIVLWAGAKEVVMCGFSFQGGHSYIEGETPRHNLSGDVAFFHTARDRGLAVKTTSAEIHDLCGTPLAE